MLASRCYDRNKLLTLSRQPLPPVPTEVCRIIDSLGISSQSPTQVRTAEQEGGTSTAQRPSQPRPRPRDPRGDTPKQKASENDLPRKHETESRPAIFEKGKKQTSERGSHERPEEGRNVSNPSRAAGSNRRGQFIPDNFTNIKNPDEMALEVLQNIRSFEIFLGSPVISHTDSRGVLKVLSGVTKSQHRESIFKVLQTVCASPFLDIHLPVFITNLQASLEKADSESSRASTETVAFNASVRIFNLVSNICHRLPSSAPKCSLLLSFLSSAQGIMAAAKSRRPTSEKTLRDLQHQCEDCTRMIQDAAQARPKATRTKKETDEDDVAPPEDFAKLPIFPDGNDMDWTEKPFLRANKAQGAFKDVAHYLDVQFRLLREDYVRPLRNGIKEYQRAKRMKEPTHKNKDLRLYEGVKILGLRCTDALEHVLQFDNAHMQHINWNYSKRLQYGNLLCLSSDDFKTTYLAVVTNRTVEKLEQGILQVAFEQRLEEILGMSTDTVFTMAETKTFFEAYRHVLEGLQQVKTLPMQRYIVDCTGDIIPPSYLAKGAGMAKLKLSSLLREGSRHDATSVTSQWPPVEELALNESQLEAVKTALTKELAIIQGPPGAGKTYVGLKVARVLLDNAELWTNADDPRPILVVCYTNHALDQFLEGILKFCPDGIIRVGGRSKSSALECFNLNNIRSKRRMTEELKTPAEGSASNSYRELKELRAKVEKGSALGSAPVLSRNVLKETLLIQSMLPGQYPSLTNIGMNAAREQSGNLMVDWLAFGNTLLGLSEESDPYNMLKQELTAQILGGRDSCSAPEIDLENVSKLSHKDRAQLYRSWVKKAVDRSMELMHTAEDESQKAYAKKVQELAAAEILPDDCLKPVMDVDLYSAITSSILHKNIIHGQFCIALWLGVNTSKKVMPQILQGIDDNCDEKNFTPESVLRIPRRIKIRLYRYWLKSITEKMTQNVEAGKKAGRLKLEYKKILENSQKQLLSDNELKLYVDSKLFSAIRSHMMQRLEQVSKYCIRRWLGFPDLSRNPQTLEERLKEYTGAAEDSTARADTAIKRVEGERKEREKQEKEDIPERDNRRLDDDDYEPFHLEQSCDLSGALASFETEDSDNMAAEWTIPKDLRKRQIKKVQRSLLHAKPMTEEEAKAVTDVWDPKLKLEDRVRLYKFWLSRYQPRLRSDLRRDAEAFIQEARLYQELKSAGDCEILRQAKVIGMTTTGAARYRKVLANVGCPIVMIEEAAEVLEAHVVTTLHESCQHLILIGDHQQLRPSPTVYELCRHYHLDVSLFERLVNNKLHHSTLAVQHRMRPEIARLVRHVYPHLKDHVTTERRPHIRGMKQDVFLFHHEFAEATHDDTSSKSNVHEAELCVSLCRYLLQQEYEPDSITILAAYTGQVLAIKNLIKGESMFKGAKVISIDNYQGEENDIIILSLVRSNEEGTVGFLGTDNRVCVALSRARNGLYAFGNFRILAEKSQLWKNVVKTAKEHDQMGEALILRCGNHPETELHVTTAEDFKNAPNGGCMLPCKARLDCGHACTDLCHPSDPEHKVYRCKKRCERQVCEENIHPCPRKCHEACGSCAVKVEKIVPGCEHKEMVPCSTEPADWTCTQKCPETLDCGHQCSGTCGECGKKAKHVTKCKIVVERTWSCGHRVKAQCYRTPDDFPCTHPCGATLDCGHPCPGTCDQCLAGRVHLMCKAPCGKQLPGCSHICPLTCGTKCLPCKKECPTQCRHSQCTWPCGMPCSPCQYERCPWRCEHKKCEAMCSAPCEPCQFNCQKKLSCGHACMSFCGEKCLCLHCEKEKFIPLSSEGKPLIAKEKAPSVDEKAYAVQKKLPSPEEEVLTSEREASSSEETLMPQKGEMQTSQAAIVAGDENWLSTERDAPSSVEETSSKVDESSRFIKLPGCGHIFRADAVDSHVNRVLKSSFRGTFFPCPACSKETVNCWRYQKQLLKHHSMMQETKKRLRNATIVPTAHAEKIMNSMAMLESASGKDACFASADARKRLSKKRLRVNQAFTLTIQTRLTRVLEIITGLLEQQGNGNADSQSGIEQVETSVGKLEQVILKVETAMTNQRCRELTAETRRLTYMAVLNYVKQRTRARLSSSPAATAKKPAEALSRCQLEERIQQAETFLGKLEDPRHPNVPKSEIEKFFDVCRRTDSSWRGTVDDTVFTILDSPLEETLCDIKKGTRQPAPRQKDNFADGQLQCD